MKQKRFVRRKNVNLSMSSFYECKRVSKYRTRREHITNWTFSEKALNWLPTYVGTRKEQLLSRGRKYLLALKSKIDSSRFHCLDWSFVVPCNSCDSRSECRIYSLQDVTFHLWSDPTVTVMDIPYLLENLRGQSSFRNSDYPTVSLLASCLEQGQSCRSCFSGCLSSRTH